MIKPLLLAFVLFMLGIISARHIFIPPSFIIIIALYLFAVTLISLTKKRGNFRLTASILIFLLGSLAYINAVRLPANHIAGLSGKEEGKKYLIQAEIVSSPDVSQSFGKENRISFTAKVSAYKVGDLWFKLSGLTRAEIKQSRLSFHYGDKMLISAVLAAPPHAEKPGEFDYAEYLKTKKIYTVLEADSDDDISLFEEKGGFSAVKTIFKIREKIESLIDEYMPDEQGAVLKAMLIGRRADIGRDVNDIFVKTGTAHILSVSGLHVAIIAGMVFFLLALLNIPRKIAGIIAIVFLAGYTVLAGGDPPILRSSIMIGIFLLAYILEREFDPLSALSLAGLIILVVNPLDLFTASFALSFLCVFSLCYITPRIFDPAGIQAFTAVKRGERFLARASRSTVRYMLNLFIASLAVSIGVFPVVAYYFGIVSPVSMVANLVTVPLTGVALFLGMLFACLGHFSYAVAHILSKAVEWLLLAFISITKIFSDMPLAYFYVKKPGFLAIGFYYIFLFTALNRKALSLSRARVAIFFLITANIYIWGDILTSIK